MSGELIRPEVEEFLRLSSPDNQFWGMADSDVQELCNYILHLEAKLQSSTAREASLVEALKLWVKYDDQDEADFSEAGPMLLYAEAINATRAALQGRNAAGSSQKIDEQEALGSGDLK